MVSSVNACKDVWVYVVNSHKEQTHSRFLDQQSKELGLELKSVGNLLKYVNQDCHMQRSILKIAQLGQQCKAERREESRERGSRNKGLSYKDLLRKKERQFLL